MSDDRRASLLVVVAHPDDEITDCLDPDVFAAAPEMVAVSIAQMLRAFRPVLQHEVFLLGGARGAIPRWPLLDFFDGLDAARLH